MMAERHFHQRWPKMRDHLVKLIRQQNISQLEWQSLFWDIHHVCLWDEGGSSQMYAALHTDIIAYIKDSHEEVLKNQEDIALLNAYIREWRKFFAQCNYLPLPFNHSDMMNQSKVATLASVGQPKRSDTSEVRQMMLVSWNDCIFQKIRNRLQGAALKLIEAERNGEAFDSQLVIGVRESYVNLIADPENPLEVYVAHFEQPYISATAQYYAVKTQQFLEDNGVYAYMYYAEQKKKEETARGAKYLDSSVATSLNNLNDCLVKEIIERYMDQMLEKCPELIKTNDTEKLALLYRLMSEIPEDRGITPMLKHIHDYILEQGLADMRANANTITQDCEKYVEALLELYEKFTTLVERAANNNYHFTSTRDQAFEKVINDSTIFTIEIPNRQRSTKTTPESRCPELLANYCDMLLRKTALSKRLTSDEIDTRLKNILTLLEYIRNRDVFVRCYKYHLTRRLILDISADNEKEEFMVEQLREKAMPAEPVNNMLRMFQDIKVSQDLNQEFKKAQALKGSITDVVNIKILNVGSWIRSSEIVPVSLPMELEDIIPEVEEFYKQKHSGRKLQWHHHMANGTISFTNSVGKFDLEITTLQMAVLFAWNQRPLDKISFEGLRLATELPEQELRKTLFSLVNFAKLKKQVVLCDLPDLKTLKDFNDSTYFWINQEFCIIKNNKPQKRGRINLIGRLQLASEKAAEENHQEIAVLRELRTEEGIMKIMKMRKKISYAQLQTELVEILKGQFAPSRKLIKECIEKLINNNHIARSDHDLNEYKYVA